MIAITSISPNHRNNDIQAKSVASWIDLGFIVYSLNVLDEVHILMRKDCYKKVNFIAVPELLTTKSIFGKPYVKINTLLNFGLSCNSEVFALINSDIELYDSSETLLFIESTVRRGSFVYASRFDYNNSINENKSPIAYGIDVFFFNKKNARLLPQNDFSMGQCWWDYWLPYTMIKNEIESIGIEAPFAYHKSHEIQWNESQWSIAKQFFLNENKDVVDSSNIGTILREEIKSKSIIIL